MTKQEALKVIHTVGIESVVADLMVAMDLDAHQPDEAQNGSADNEKGE